MPRFNTPSHLWMPLLGLLLASCLPLAADDIEPLLKAQTVMVRVEREGKSPEIGSGVVVCQTPDVAYILTARHVLFGKSLPNRRAPGLAEVSRIEISFHRDLVPPVEQKEQEEVITIRPSGKEKDLLLLTVPVQGTLRPAVLGAAPAETEFRTGQSQPEPVVYAIGYRQGGPGFEAEPWAFSQGRLVQRDAEFLHHSATMTSGFSGGPLFNESGALIGINLRVESGIEIGAAADAEFGRALLIEEVARLADRLGLPAACLQSADPLRELAYSTYRRAMRAVSIKDWPEAGRLMRETLKHLPWEGGSVHLQGMRYTTYLPHYHLGLSLYKNGNCREALREWGRSEVQQAIRNDKRYRKMKRYRNRCERVLEQQLRESSPPTKGE